MARSNLSSEQTEELLDTLQSRFKKNMHRHEGIAWADVQAKLDVQTDAMWSLHRMETTGGEPDVVGRDATTGEILFCDCSAQSPKGRRNVCYDRAALESRKANKPDNSALEMAAEMGIELLTEEQYRDLQSLGEFDTTMSSWVTTPAAIRERGGALFMDRRYDHVSTYHNGAKSYYASRGFRGALRV